LYQLGCCESQADFEALVTLAVSFIVIMAVNVIGWLTWRRFKRAG
jgi:Tfp pilus assembly protein PilW